MTDQSVFAGPSSRVDIAASRSLVLDGDLAAEGGAVALSALPGAAEAPVVAVKGHLSARAGGAVSLSLPGEGSVLSGWAVDGEGGGGITLGMGPGSLWTVRQTADVPDSRVRSLAAGVGSRIDMQDPGASFSLLRVGELSGNGLFLVDTDIEADRSDRIHVGTGSGSHALRVKPTGVQPVREAMEGFLVRRDAGDAAFTLANPGNRVEAGLYFYELAERSVPSGGQGGEPVFGAAGGAASGASGGAAGSGGSAKEWYLRRMSVPPPDPVPPVPPSAASVPDPSPSPVPVAPVSPLCPQTPGRS